MKILILGLDCAAPEILLRDESLPNFRRLMDGGCYGRLESVVPPITVPAWMCMSTSQDPGSLGVYGFRNRADHSYDEMKIVTSKSIRELAIWDQVAREGNRSIIMGVPPCYPPRKINGISVGCMLTPDTAKDDYTHPKGIKQEIESFIGQYPADVKGFRTDDKAWLKDEILSMSRRQFEVVRQFIKHQDWDFFHFVDIGLDRMQHGFWRYHDPEHRLYQAGNPFENAIRDYYRYLDEQLGSVLELLTEDTVVLVVSDHGAQRLDGGFCINEWLVQEGYLVLNHYPDKITSPSEMDVNWDRTTVWSEGGYYARVFLNVKGREPRGVIEKGDVLKFRDELKAKLEALPDPDGKPLGSKVFKPEEIYSQVTGVSPDLIVHLGGLYWRSIGGVGYPSLWVQENDTGPDDCNHAQYGAFILAASNNHVSGEVEGAHLLDIAPTLLDLGGYDVPASMQGKIIKSDAAPAYSESGYSASGEQMIRDRLSGLGYI